MQKAGLCGNPTITGLRIGWAKFRRPLFPVRSFLFSRQNIEPRHFAWRSSIIQGVPVWVGKATANRTCSNRNSRYNFLPILEIEGATARGSCKKLRFCAALFGKVKMEISFFKIEWLEPGQEQSKLSLEFTV